MKRSTNRRARFDALGRTPRVLLGLGATFFVVLLPFVEVLVGRRSAMYLDVNEAHVPLARAAWQAIRHGNAPWWTPRIFAGHNLLGGGQAAIFYPPNALFGWFHPVTAYRWWLLFHIVLAAGGGFAWSLHRWRSVTAATVSGIAYGLNGYLVIHLVHMPLVATAAWLPWVFLGVDLLIEKWTFPRGLLLAGSLAAIAYAGHPQGLWITMIGLGITAAIQLIGAKGGLLALVRVSGGLVFGMCLAAIQLIPLLAFSRTSHRPHLEQRLALGYQDDQRHLLTMLAPKIVSGPIGAAWGPAYVELANYFGITVVALAVIGVVGLGRDRRSFALLAIAGFGVLTAMGVHTPFARLVYTFVPFADRFRGWPRNLMLANLAFACLAGAGVRHALTSSKPWAKRVAIAAGVFAAFLAVLPLLTDLGQAIVHGADSFFARALPIALLLGLVAGLALLRRARLLGSAVIIAVCGLDMVAFTFAAPWRTEGVSPPELTTYYSEKPPPIGVPADAPGGIDRWVTNSRVLHATSLVKGLLGVNGYDPLIQQRFALVAGDMDDAGGTGNKDFWEPGWLNDILRVTTSVVTPAIQPEDPLWHREGLVAKRYTRYTRTPRLADAYLVGNVVVAPFGAIQEALMSPDTDLTGTAYVERPDADVVAGLDTPGASGEVLSGGMEDDGHGRWTVNAERPSLLVLSWAWLDGWKAEVDGKPAPVLHTDGVVLGIPVPAGQHEVTLHFDPPGLKKGILLFVVGVVGLVVVSVVVRTRRHRGAPAKVQGCSNSPTP